METPTAHAVLRDRRDWLGLRHGLVLDGDGNLTLARIPAASGKPVDIATSYPYPRQVSGIAAGPCASLFVADTQGDRILYIDGLCGAQAWLGAAGAEFCDLPGHFKSPRGLALGDDTLSVADSGNGRVQSLALPRLEANLSYPQWGEPTSIALDSQGRLLVVDAASGTLHRLKSDRTADAAFDVRIAAEAKLQQPLFVTCGTDDCVLVSEQSTDQVFMFVADGGFIGNLAGPAGWQPGALAIFGDRIYVADAASGAILVFDAGVFAAQLAGWRGPVTALAVNEAGDLFIKSGLDATYYRFAADTAYAAAGELAAGPFDAGEDREWERAWAEVSLPAGTSLTISVAVQPAGTPAPAASDWVTLPSLDALLALSTSGNRRFVWLKLALATTSARASPVLAQMRVATAAENLLDYLPLTYGLHDGPSGFLTRWLKLVRGEFGRIEELLDVMPRLCDPRFAPASALPWLAQWLSLELPQIADDGERRALIARAVHLMARRGTPASIAEFVELHTGIRPAIVEAFNDRPIWILGTGSQLGFDTRLPPLDPFGMTVADEGAGQGCCPPTDPAAPASRACAPCGNGVAAASSATPPGAGPVGRAIVGESGPLAAYQVGLPLFSEEAYRFCVVVDAYRAHDPATRAEIARIVDREKPAHTDYRIALIAPEFRIGLQATLGVDSIVGGDPPPLRLEPARLGYNAWLPPSDVARFGEAVLDGLLTLN